MAAGRVVAYSRASWTISSAAMPVSSAARCGVQERLGDGLAKILFVAGRDHAGDAQRAIQIGLRLDGVKLCPFAEGGHVGVQHGAVQGGGIAYHGAGEPGVDLHMAAGHAALDDGADVVLQRIQFVGQMEVQIQSPMVHALQTEDEFALRDLFPYTGKARHAAYAQWSTTDPASSNWSSWSR